MGIPTTTTTTVYRSATWLILLLAVLCVIAGLIVWAVARARPSHDHIQTIVPNTSTLQASGFANPILSIWPSQFCGIDDPPLVAVFSRAFPQYEVVQTTDANFHAKVHATQGCSVLGVVGVRPSFRIKRGYPAWVPLMTLSTEPYDVGEKLTPSEGGYGHYPASAYSRAAIRVVTSRPQLVAARNPEAIVVHIPQALYRDPAGLPADGSLRRFAHDNVAARPKALGYVNSNCTPRHRETFFRRAVEVLGKARVTARGDCGRRWTGETQKLKGRWTDQDWERGMVDCVFIMAIENMPPSTAPGYVSEKIVNAFLAGAIPVYWGCSATAERLFNPAAYLDVDKLGGPEATLRHMQDLLKHPAKLRAMRAAPVFRTPKTWEEFLQDPQRDATVWGELRRALQHVLQIE